jgi:membrane-bound lytic murein transglycosylase B
MRRRSFIGRAACLAAVYPIASAAETNTADFRSWLESFKADAEAAGISRATLDGALDGLQPIQHVLDLDQHQPESTITFATYITKSVNPQRIETGRQRLAENRGLLEEIGSRYNVQPRFIVALWGLETDFGAFTGGFSIVASLATLAWGSSRPELFRSELVAALKIIDRNHVSVAEMTGSWAGAMGQTQFMPSSYLKYAVSYNHEGYADIWRIRGDVFASIANYLSHEGWDGTYTWGREVILPAKFDTSMLGGKTVRPIAAWDALGVRRADGGALPRAAIEGGLVQPGGKDGPTLLTYGNYRVIMRWNHSNYFATSVSYLADKIAV